MQPELRTARLRLVPVTADDTGFLHRLLSEPGVREFLCDGRILPWEAVTAWIAQSAGLAHLGLGLWRIEADGGFPVGCAGLLPLSAALASTCPDFAGEVEPVLALTETAWGRGYAGEALCALAGQGFRDLARERIVAAVDEPNARSHALMRRAGYRQTGTVAGPRYPLRSYELRR